MNDTEVQSLGRSVIDGPKPGIAGIRVNHNLDVHIDGFTVTRDSKKNR